MEQLRPNDRFSLVAFAGEAVTLIPNSPGREKRRILGALDGLDRLQLGDETRIGSGDAAGAGRTAPGRIPGLAPGCWS